MSANNLPALAMTENTLITVLENSLYPGADTTSIALVINYCRAAGLDPMQKPVHIVPMWDSKSGRMRDVIMPGVGLYRTQAARSGQYAGVSEPEFGPDVPETIGGVAITYPSWCRVTVKRLLANGIVAEFAAVERWKENYAVKGGKDKSIAPNAMWQKRPYAQLAKCFDEKTEVLTTEGFQLFSEVTGRVLHVTETGLEATDAKPFMQQYDGQMVSANGTRLNFCVTPNHDMLTNKGKIEASILYEHATKDSSKWSIPRVVTQSREDANISDIVLELAGYLLADGSHTGYKQFRIAVSRPYKIMALENLSLHTRRVTKKDAGREAKGNFRTIKTISDKQSFTYDFALVSRFMSAEKQVDPDWILSLSARQAKIVVDALLEFDGSHNGTVRRLHQGNVQVIKAFELLSVQAGYSISKATAQKSEIGNCWMFTLSESKASPVVRGIEDKNAASLTMTINETGKVWCVTVPSGVIVVRRNGFSMLCGNCAQAQALRMAFPEMVGAQPTADEMEGKSVDEFAGATVDGATGEVMPKELPPYTAAQIQKNIAAWKQLIADGKKDADQIIAMIASKHTLTDEQKATIRACATIANEMTYADVAEALHKARTDAERDTAADLIGSVADAQQRQELTDLYNQLKAE